MSENTEGVGTPTPADRVPGPDHRAESPVLTQSKAFWRTFLQVGLPALVSFALILPEVIGDFVEQFGYALPDGFRAALLGIAGAITLVSSMIAWFMANPKVLAWTRKYARFFALPTK